MTLYKQGQLSEVLREHPGLIYFEIIGIALAAAIFIGVSYNLLDNMIILSAIIVGLLMQLGFAYKWYRISKNH
jgi:hypothetical protein